MDRRIALAAGAVALLAGAYWLCAQARVTGEQVRRELDRELPNATRPEVESWLSMRHCEWNYVPGVPGSPKYSGAIRAVMHDPDRCSAPTKSDVHMVILFGADDRIADRLVSEEPVE